MLFTDVIRTKRDGGTLTDAQIQFFVKGLTDQSIPAEQVSALAMAIFLNSMTFDEAGKLTLAMAQSGNVLEWHDLGLDGPVVDKHSTGGVGDKVTHNSTGGGACLQMLCGDKMPVIEALAHSAKKFS